MSVTLVTYGIINSTRFVKISFTYSAVPALQCVGTRADNGGVLVEWKVDHTGGQDLELTEILVQYKLIADAQFQDISDPADVSKTSVLVEEQFVPGSTYEFRVQAGNTIGYSSFALCDSAIIEEGMLSACLCVTVRTVHVCMCMCMCMCVCVCMCSFSDFCVYACVCTCMCMYMHMFVCVLCT